MSLGLLTAMLDGVQQFGVNSRKTGQLLSVEFVGLAFVGIDQPGLARIGYKDFVAALMEDPAYPGWVGAHLDGDLHLLFGVEAAAQAIRGGTQSRPSSIILPLSLSRTKK
jgi:hypothetical protein